MQNMQMTSVYADTQFNLDNLREINKRTYEPTRSCRDSEPNTTGTFLIRATSRKRDEIDPAERNHVRSRKSSRRDDYLWDPGRVCVLSRRPSFPARSGSADPVSPDRSYIKKASVICITFRLTRTSQLYQIVCIGMEIRCGTSTECPSRDSCTAGCCTRRSD